MRSVEEHLAAVLAAVAPLPPVRVPLEEARGLVLCEDVRARVDLPGFDNSAMDGYAVRAVDVVPATGEDGAPVVTLPVVGEVAAGGDAAGLAVGRGEAVRIMTGAMLPPGADAVVRVEDTDGGTDTVEVRRGVPAGTSVRRAGEDVRAGDTVLEAGLALDSRRLAVLAASGHGDALVRPRPRVAVVSTGAELVAPGAPLAPGEIHDSNSHMLDACVVETGGTTVRRLSTGDDPVEVARLLVRLAEEVDLVLTSGGVSMGAYDVVKAALRDLGTVEFVQVAMQPGKPQGFGVLGDRAVPLLALPGNPVSSYVSFEVFARPALRRMLGRSPERRPARTARLNHDLRSPAGRQQVARAVARRLPPVNGDTSDDGTCGWTVEPVWGQASHFLGDLSRANALVIVPADVTVLESGDEVELWLLDDAEDRVAW